MKRYDTELWNLLVSVQNDEKNINQDIITITGFMKTDKELIEHYNRYADKDNQWIHEGLNAPVQANEVNTSELYNWGKSISQTMINIELQCDNETIQLLSSCLENGYIDWAKGERFDWLNCDHQAYSYMFATMEDLGLNSLATEIKKSDECEAMAVLDIALNTVHSTSDKIISKLVDSWNWSEFRRTGFTSVLKDWIIFNHSSLSDNAINYIVKRAIRNHSDWSV